MSNRGTARNVVRVGISSGSLANCINHAFTTEGEEVMGLLLGNTHEVAEGDFVTNIWRAVPQIRNDRRKDRVECGGEQMAQVAQTAEQLSASTGRETRVVGWYHSHPHITALPSHIDIATQEGYQRMDGGFVGIIVSCFNAVAATGPASRMQALAFQSVPAASPDLGAVDHAYLRALDSPTRRAILESSEEARGAAGSGLVHRLVPLHVDASLEDGPAALADAAALQDTLFQEEARPFHAARRALSAAASDATADERFLARQRAGALYVQGLAELLQTALLPALGAVRGLRCTVEQERAELLRRLDYARDHLQDTEPEAARRAHTALGEHSAKQEDTLRELRGRHAQRQAAVAAAAQQPSAPQMLLAPQAAQPLPQQHGGMAAAPMLVQGAANGAGTPQQPPPFHQPRVPLQPFQQPHLQQQPQLQQQPHLFQQYRPPPAAQALGSPHGGALVATGAALHAFDRPGPSVHSSQATTRQPSESFDMERPDGAPRTTSMPEQRAPPPHAGEWRVSARDGPHEEGSRWEQASAPRGRSHEWRDSAPAQEQQPERQQQQPWGLYGAPTPAHNDERRYGSSSAGESPCAPAPHSDGRGGRRGADRDQEERVERLSARFAAADACFDATPPASPPPRRSPPPARGTPTQADESAWPALGAGAPPGESSPQPAQFSDGRRAHSPVAVAPAEPQRRADALFQEQLPPPRGDGDGGGPGRPDRPGGQQSGGGGRRRGPRGAAWRGHRTNFPPDKQAGERERRRDTRRRGRPGAARREDIEAGHAPEPREFPRN